MKQKSSLTLVACLLSYFLSKHREEVNSWLIGRAKRLHRNRLEMVIRHESSIHGSFVWCRHLRCSRWIPGRQGHVRVCQWADDCDVPMSGFPLCQGTRVRPSGRLASDLHKPCGSFVLGIDAIKRARAISSLRWWCRMVLPGARLHMKLSPMGVHPSATAAAKWDAKL